MYCDNDLRAAYNDATGYVDFTYEGQTYGVQQYLNFQGAWRLTCVASFGGLRARYVSDVMALIRSADVPQHVTFKIRGATVSKSAVRVGDTYYTNAYAMNPCRNCHEPWHTHIDNRCLFEPSEFEPHDTVCYIRLEDALREGVAL